MASRSISSIPLLDQLLWEQIFFSLPQLVCQSCLTSMPFSDVVQIHLGMDFLLPPLPDLELVCGLLCLPTNRLQSSLLNPQWKAGAWSKSQEVLKLLQSMSLARLWRVSEAHSAAVYPMGSSWQTNHLTSYEAYSRWRSFWQFWHCFTWNFCRCLFKGSKSLHFHIN